MKKLLIAVLLGIFLIPTPSRAASSLEVIMEDALWGAAIGTLVGAATLPFMKNPSKHYDRLAQGAGLGLMGGIAFGVYEISPIFYTYKDPAHGQQVYALRVVVPLN